MEMLQHLLVRFADPPFQASPLKRSTFFEGRPEYWSGIQHVEEMCVISSDQRSSILMVFTGKSGYI